MNPHHDDQPLPDWLFYPAFIAGAAITAAILTLLTLTALTHDTIERALNHWKAPKQPAPSHTPSHTPQ